MGRLSRRCRIGLAAFLLVYLAAFAFAVIGTRGLLGVEPNAMSAVGLIVLGMPWTLALAFLPGEGLQIFGRLFIATAPLLNLWLLSLICRRRRRRRS